MRKRSILAGFALLCLATLPSRAQFTNKSSVLDGSGTTSSGGTFTNISAAGQPGGISVSDAGTLVNQAGFLNTFFMRPALDTDHDGIPDEADIDNDNDGLVDTAEINGSAFTPATLTAVNSSDTDGDGMNDGREALDGSDPTDASAVFELVRIINTGAVGGITFLARGNSEKTYVVKASSLSYTQPSQVIFSNSVAGGVAPWFQVTNSVSDNVATNGRFYSVEVVP